jgi:hypothetical protein
MNGDGKPEIVSGGVVVDAQGRLVSGVGREGAGTNGPAVYGGNSLVADVDGDGQAEILTGAAAYAFYARVDGVAPGAVVECQEDNNAAGIGGVTCPTIN